MSKQSGIGFLKSMLKFSISSWVQAIISLVSIPIITRLFTPEEYGKINIFNIAVSMAVIFVGLSMEQSYFRFYKECSTDDERKNMLTQCIAVTLLAFIVFYILVLSFGNQLSIYLFGGKNNFVIYFLYPSTIIVTLFMLYQNIYFRMSENVFCFFIFGLASAISSKIFLVFGALYNPTYSYAITFTLVGLAIEAIFFRVFHKKSFDINFPIINKKKVLPLIKYSIPLLPGAFIGFLNNAVTRFFLKDYLSYSALGIFSVAASIAGLLSLIESGFTTYWTPFMYSHYKTETTLIKRIHSGISFIMTFMGLLIILFNPIIFFILGKGYKQGQGVFAFLLINYVVDTISLTTCYGIYISKKTYLFFYCSFFSFLVNATFCFFLIPTLGILGAGIANALGGIVLFSVRTYFGQKEYLSIEKFFRTILSIFILIIASFVNYFVNDIVIRSSLVTFLIIIILIIYNEIFRNITKSITVFEKS